MRGLIGLGIALAALWLVAWLVLKVASAAIHLLLVIAVIVIIWALVRGGARRVGL